MSLRFNTAQWNTTQWNGLTTPIVVVSDKVLYNQRSVSISWNSVAGATSYEYQVSMFHDFRTIFETAIHMDKQCKHLLTFKMKDI